MSRIIWDRTRKRSVFVELQPHTFCYPKPVRLEKTSNLSPTLTLLNLHILFAFLLKSAMESTSLQPVSSNIVWDDDDDDFEQLLSQFPTELPTDKPLIDNDSVLTGTPSIDDDNLTRLDATRRASAMLTGDNQSFIHNTTKIELSSQPNLNKTRLSTSSLQRSSTGPLSPIVTRNLTKINSPRVRCDSSSVIKKKTPCSEAEIEQKRLAALALRRQREQQQQQKKR